MAMKPSNLAPRIALAPERLTQGRAQLADILRLMQHPERAAVAGKQNDRAILRRMATGELLAIGHAKVSDQKINFVSIFMTDFAQQSHDGRSPGVIVVKGQHHGGTTSADQR